MNWKVNDTAVLAVTVTQGGVPATGLAPTCTLIRRSDGQFYDWAGGWQVPAASTPMPEIYPGHYQVSFPQGTADPNKWETYLAFYQSSGAKKFYQSELHVFRSSAGESLSVTSTGTIGDALRIVLGILYANAVLDNTVYNSDGLLISGRVRLFATPGAAGAATDGAADDAEGEWARFTVTGEAEGSPADFTKTFRMTRTK